MVDRWEDNVHYYDYNPETVKRWSNRDAFVVAEAWIHSKDGTRNIGLVFVVSGQDLKISGIKWDEAIKGAEQLRATLVKEWRGREEEVEEDILVLFNWRGQEIERRSSSR